jgi:hypothetical protein
MSWRKELLLTLEGDCHRGRDAGDGPAAMATDRGCWRRSRITLGTQIRASQMLAKDIGGARRNRCCASPTIMVGNFHNTNQGSKPGLYNTNHIESHGIARG